MATAVLAVFSAGFFWKIWASLPPGRLESPLGRLDAIAAICLAVWFLWVVAASSGGPQVVTPIAILTSGIVYSGLVGLIVIFLTVRRIPLGGVFGIRWEGWRAQISLVGIAFLAVLPLVGLSQWSGSLIFGEHAEAQPLLDYWLQETGFGNRALVVVMAVVVAPLAEEFLFRGYLYGTASRYVGSRWAILASSLLFAAIHAHLPAFLGLFVLSLALNLVYARTQSIWAPVLMHSAFNTVTLVASLVWPELA